VTAPSTVARSGTRASSRPDRGLVQHVLGPDERLLAMLPGQDARGAVTWLVTNFRLVMLSQARPDDAITTIPVSSVCCVEQRTDPVGTWLRVRATGRQYALSHIDPLPASQFCAVLRERAGIGAPPAPPRRAPGLRDPLRTGFANATTHSPR
jgi:hypothetical protein